MQSLGGAHCPVPVHLKYRTVASEPLPSLASVNSTFSMTSPRKVEVDEGRILSAIVRDNEIGVLDQVHYPIDIGKAYFPISMIIRTIVTNLILNVIRIYVVRRVADFSAGEEGSATPDYIRGPSCTKRWSG